MKAQTFTLIVTVIDDAQPSIHRLAGMVHRALEEGVPEYGHFTACCVDAFEGDRLYAHGPDHERLTRVKVFHQREVRDAALDTE